MCCASDLERCSSMKVVDTDCGLRLVLTNSCLLKSLLQKDTSTLSAMYLQLIGAKLNLIESNEVYQLSRYGWKLEVTIWNMKLSVVTGIYKPKMPLFVP